MSTTDSQSVLNDSVSDSNSTIKPGVLEGPILGTTVKLGTPIFISFVFTLLYNIVDTLFLSYIDRSSTAIISGVSLIGPIYSFFLALSTGLRVGISSLVARSCGEKNYQKLEEAFNSGFLITIILTVITLGVGYLFHEKIVLLMAGKELQPEALRAANDFFYYMLPGFGVLLLGQPLIGVLWGEGLTMPFGITLVISNILNILLDILFICILHMGPAGAALATTLSLVFSAVYLIPYFFSGKLPVPVYFRISQIKKNIIAEICNIGSSQVFSLISISLAFMVLNNLVGSIGQTEMNSWGICGRLDQLVFMPLFAISGANIIMIGQNFGNRNWDRIKKIYQSNIFYALSCMFVLVVIYICGAPFFLHFFSGVEEVMRGSVLQIRIVTLSFLGVACEIISTSTFQGLGRPFAAFWLAAIRMFVFAIPLSYCAVYKFSLGMTGIFSSLFVAHICTGIIAFLWVNHEFKKLKLANSGSLIRADSAL